MLKDFIDSSAYEYLPLSGKKYLINVFGNVISTSNVSINKTIDSDNDECVYIDFINGPGYYKLSFLLCLTFKPVHIPVIYFSLLKVIFVDGNSVNLDLNNLIWKFPVGGIPCVSIPGFYYIPGYTRYVMNKQAEVRDYVNNNILSMSRSNLYYGTTTITDTNKKEYTGRHRLFALTFLDYPANVDKLVVNHINGVRGDDWESNLEWCTRQENAIHAYATGLRNDNHDIFVRNVLTGEVKEYYSYEDCARTHGTDGETIRLRVKANGQKVYVDNGNFYQFKRKNDETPWREVIDPYTEGYRGTTAIPITVFNIFTKETKNFTCLKDASIFTGVKEGTISWGMSGKEDGGRPVNNFLFRKTWIKDPWPEFTKLELDFYSKSITGRGRGYVLLDIETNEEEVFDTVITLSKFLGIEKKSIVRVIEANKILNNKYKVYYIFKNQFGSQLQQKC